MKAPRRFWLTLFAAVAFAILLGLGTWQLQRLAWKRDVIARVEAARTAEPLPLAGLADQLRRGHVAEWTRVEARCDGSAGWPPSVEYSLYNGQIAWRALSACTLANAGLTVWIDRGIIGSATGNVDKPTNALPPPSVVLGVLRSRPGIADRLSPIDSRARHPAPAIDLVLVAERETPQPAGITPQALPPEISNRHLGYAITWYGLAAALAGVYVAMLIQDRRRARSPGTS